MKHLKNVLFYLDKKYDYFVNNLRSESNYGNKIHLSFLNYADVLLLL